MAVSLCRQLSESVFVLVVGHQVLCGLWDGVLLHSWLLPDAGSSQAWGTAHVSATRPCTGHSCGPSSPSVPAFPMQRHAAHAQADETAVALGFAVADLLLGNQKPSKTFPMTSSYVLGPVVF